jgi:2-polyprenyl-3-methyl-5-hydroxy-6-metoxy-1,4-benzoquinol methylase
MALQPIDYYDPTHYDVESRRLEERERTAISLLGPILAGEAGELLDVGCGDGFFMRALDLELELTDRDWRLTGVDFSEYQLELAHRLPYRFSRCNLEDGIPFGDACFDVVFAGEIIEHLYNPDYLLEECRRVVKPGGHLVVTTPNLQAWYNRALFLLGIQPLFYETSTRTTAVGAGPLRRVKRGSDPVGHLRVFNRAALLDLMRHEGFEPLRVEGAIMPVFPRPLKAVDSLFTRFTSLASELVVLARVGSRS